MRISDWSSDVCSSDLVVQSSGLDTLADERVDVVAVGPGLGRGKEGKALLGRAIDSGHALVIDGDGLTLLADGEPFPRWAATPIQLGRASCRERVCPYV